MLEVTEKDIKIFIITVFKMFMLKKLSRDTDGIKKIQLEFEEMENFNV